MPKNIFSELTGLFSLKDDIKKILETQKRIDKKIEKLDGKISKLGKGVSGKKVTRVSTRKKKRITQPPLDSVIVDVMKKSKKPLTVNQLEEIIKKEKRFVSNSKNFKNNIRVVLYKNDKKSFRKVAPGKFALKGNAGKK